MSAPPAAQPKPGTEAPAVNRRDALVWPRIIVGFFVAVFTFYAFFLYTAFTNMDPVVESYEQRAQ